MVQLSVITLRKLAMILSMTGYASQENNTENGVLIIELRSVNHRYLELQLKCDDTLRSLEAVAREMLQAKLGRGKVDVRISMMRAVSAESAQKLDHHIVQQIAENAKTVAQYFPHIAPINVLEILRMPGVINVETFDNQALEHDLKAALALAINQLIEAKSREGTKLTAVILDRLAQIERHVATVKPMMPALVSQYQAKLCAKLLEATNTQDDERIRQEIVLFAQRIDVDEELTRLDAHISEVKHILNVGGLVGKKLDFLMQELNREANTLGSKSVALETSKISMALKVLIEQMREQIMNLE